MEMGQKSDQTHKRTWILGTYYWKKGPWKKTLFISGPIILQIVLKPLPWPKESKLVLRFEIAWWEGGEKVDQTHKLGR